MVNVVLDPTMVARPCWYIDETGGAKIPMFICSNGHTSAIYHHPGDDQTRRVRVASGGLVDGTYDCPSCDYSEVVTFEDWPD